jgi:hypothetical protein
LWTVVTWTVARAEGYRPLASSTWARWDSGLYLQIARDGYSIDRACPAPMGYPPGSWCGTAGWFPGFPYSTRGVEALGPQYETAARLVVTVAFLVALAAAWFGPLRHRPRPQALVALALIAVFPGAIYFGALFPISIAVAGMFGCLALIDRRRWWLAGCAGAVATVAYPSGVLVGAVCVALLLDRRVGDRRARAVSAAKVGAPIVLAYLAVLTEFQRTVGHWDAWFLVQDKYEHHLTWPVAQLWHRIELLWLANPPMSRWNGAQSTLVLVVMVAAGHVVWRERARLTTAEWSCAVMVTALWVAPLCLAGDLSIHRSEALVVPVVLLVARLPARLNAFLAVAAAIVLASMAQLFFAELII